MGVMVDNQLRRAPVNDTSGVPGSYADDSAPFGREFIEESRMRLLELYLRPYVHFARLVAGMTNKTFEALVSPQYAGNAMMASLMGVQTPAYDALANMQRMRIERDNAPAAAAAGPARGGAQLPRGEVAQQNMENGNVRNVQTVPSMPTDSAFKAFKWLLENRPSVSREQQSILREMFSKQITHTVAHLSSPVNSGFIIMNEQFVSAVDQALYALRVRWRPDLADYFALNALISDDMTMSFFAQVVAGFMHSARYLGHQWRTPKHVNTANASRMINLQAESKRLVADGSGRLYFADSAPPSKAIDYNSVYRRKPNMRHPYVNPY